MMVEPDPTPNTAQLLKNYRQAVLLVLLALSGYFIYLATILKINYYDSYEYLNSAKALLNIGGYYDFSRPPVLPLLLTPILALSRLFTGHWWLTMSPYFYMLLMAALSLWICFRCWRAWQGNTIALTLTLLFALDRVFFHFALFVLPDIISTAIVAGMIYYTYQVTITEHNSDAVRAGLLLGLAVSTKHYLAPLCLVPTLFIFSQWLQYTETGWRVKFSVKQIKWLSIIAFVSAIVTLSLHRIAFWLTAEYRHQSLFDILRRTAEKGSQVNEVKYSLSLDSVLMTIHLLAASIGWPLLILAVIGILMALRRPTRLHLLILSWLLIFLTIFTAVVTHPEARYFLQVTPAILYFDGLVITEVFQLISEKRRKVAGLVTAGIMLGSVLNGTIKEVVSFTDPIYQNNVAEQLAERVEQHTPADKKIVWVGDVITMLVQPSAFINNPLYDDPFYYRFSIHSNVLAYYTNRPCYTSIYPYVFVPTLTSALQPGDTLVFFQHGEIIRPPFAPISLHTFNNYSLFIRDRSSDKQGQISLKEQTGSGRFSLTTVDREMRILSAGSTPVISWELLLNNGQQIPMKGSPLFPVPVSLSLPGAVELDSIECLATVPLTPPVAVIYY